MSDVVKDRQSWEEQDSIEFIQDGSVFVPDREEQIEPLASRKLAPIDLSQRR